MFRGVPRGQAQALLGSGLLPLLRDVNVADVSVEEFRRVCGLVPTAGSSLHFDKRKDGWTLLEHRPRTISSVADLEIVPFLGEGEASICGYELISRAKYVLDANLGQEDAEFLLAHQEEIPKAFRGHYLVFPGTVWRIGRGVDSRPDVPYIYWGGTRWTLSFDWLGGRFRSSVRLAHPRK